MKKTLTIYSAMFLFAFTFAFAFTLATPAQAINCCAYKLCGDPEYPWISVKGHYDKGACTFDGSSDCDTAWICPWPWE